MAVKVVAVEAVLALILLGKMEIPTPAAEAGAELPPTQKAAATAATVSSWCATGFRVAP